MQTDAIEILKATRNNVLRVCEGLSLEKLNKIPSGFKNNMTWNVAHTLVTQELLCYGLSGNKGAYDTEYIERYRKGTKPEKPMNSEEWDYVLDNLFSSIKRLEEDYEKGIFREFKEYATSYNYTVKSIDSAIVFNNSHEAMHLGTLLALRKFI